MRRVFTSALLAGALFSCSVVAPEYRPTPTPTPTIAAVPAPDLRPLTYEVVPLDVRSGATKTVLFFSNPNPYPVDWFMIVRLNTLAGEFLREERIGSAGVPANRSEPKFQNWYFPIPQGDSSAVVRLEVAFPKSEVREFKVARSLNVIDEFKGVRVGRHACAGDRAVGTIGCDVTLETATTVPGFSRLHLVVVVRRAASPRDALGALQWRPELLPSASPWLTLAAGEQLQLRFFDSYPTPTVPWEYDVLVHVYRFSSV